MAKKWRFLDSDLSKERLTELYREKKMSIKQIADLTGHDEQTVGRYMRKNSVRLRSHKEALQLVDYSHMHVDGLTEELLRKLYIDEWLTTYQIGDKVGCSNTAVQNALRRFGIPIHQYRVKGMDKDNLYELYVNQKLSLIKISEMLGCNNETVRKALQRHGIPVRSKSEAGKNKVITSEHMEKIKKLGNLNRGKVGKDHPAWKGGRYVNKDGYVVIRVNGKHVLEHRHVMEQYLGRKLEPWEEVN